jgi:hypothetical protein
MVGMLSLGDVSHSASLGLLSEWRQERFGASLLSIAIPAAQWKSSPGAVADTRA